MNVLVTGGSGFLGSVLVQKLVKAGHDVTSMDTRLPVTKETNFVYMRGDIKNERQCRMAAEGQDAIVNLAAIVGDKACLEDPQNAFDTNVKGTENLLKFSEGKKFFITSTCSVYGIKQGIICTEEEEPAPISNYGQTKVEAEKLVMKKKKDYKIFRLGTLYGWSPRMRFDLVVNTFIKNAYDDSRIRVFGGSQYRPLVHLADVADLIVSALKSDNDGIFNLSYDNYTILQVATKIHEKLLKMGNKCELEIVESIVDRRDYAVSTEKAKKLLGFKPKNSIELAVEEIWGRLNENPTDRS